MNYLWSIHPDISTTLPQRNITKRIINPTKIRPLQAAISKRRKTQKEVNEKRKKGTIKKKIERRNPRREENTKRRKKQKQEGKHKKVNNLKKKTERRKPTKNTGGGGRAV